MPGKINARGTVQVRFERNTIPEPNSGCHLWMAACDRHGYGQMRNGQKLIYASHIALELTGVAVPNNKFVLHHCDNPLCVNPDHLFIGNQADNVSDMMLKQRHNHKGLELGRGWQRNRTHCGRGHELTGDNVVIRTGGRRECRQCGRASRREWKRRHRATA